MFSRSFEFLARERVIIKTESEGYDAICDFIRKNADYFDAFLTDKLAVSELKKLTSLTVTELVSLRYMLSLNGLDLLVGIVAEVEENPIEIPEGILEYNIIDTNDHILPSFPFITKIVIPSTTTQLSEVYRLINDTFGFFEGDLFTDFKNPLVAMINVLEENENLLGKTIVSISDFLNNAFEFLGKRLIIISNAESIAV
jgi:hypothetical protein